MKEDCGGDDTDPKPTPKASGMFKGVLALFFAMFLMAASALVLKQMHEVQMTSATMRLECIKTCDGNPECMKECRLSFKGE